MISRFSNAVLLLVLGLGAALHAEDSLSAKTRKEIDAAVKKGLADTGAPGASIAIVKDGRIAYLQAYGEGRLDPKTSATPAMRFSIGSVSKQFTATAILMLAEQGKLSLNDPVSRFLPELTRANEVTIRQLLSHTAGYQDYWPQDYVMPMMLQPVTADKILELWARKPLDFEPGTKWQYSNTGYVIAGLIVERASGKPLFEFLREHIFTPLGMMSVFNCDQSALGDSDAAGYMRYGLGPLRPAPKEGSGWLFAAGGLAMTAEDLAKWDISIMNESLMKPESYRQLETATLLKDGTPTSYAFGVDVRKQFSHHAVSHNGEVSGYTTRNTVFPDDKIAVAVLVNQDALTADDKIAQKIIPLLFPPEDSSKEEAQARNILKGLQNGKIDRSLLTDNANAYFSDQALRDLASGLHPLGAPQSLTQSSKGERGGMIYRNFAVKFARKSVEVWQYTLPDGKIEQFQIMPAD